MSQAQIEQFAGRVRNDPAILNRLTTGTQTPDELIEKAVAMGTEAGFSFTRDEADIWVKGQIAARANGELSDLQLEGVAGGKGETEKGYKTSGKGGGKIQDPFETWLRSW